MPVWLEKIRASRNRDHNVPTRSSLGTQVAGRPWTGRGNDNSDETEYWRLRAGTRRHA